MIARPVKIAALGLALLAAPPAMGAAAAKAAPKEAAAKETAAKPEAPAATPAAKAPSAGQAAARDRQKKCGAEWRGLTDVQKTAQGPKWPQFWSACNKRLKGGDKA